MNAEETKTCLICGQTKEYHDPIVCEAVRVALRNKIERSKTGAS